MKVVTSQEMALLEKEAYAKGCDEEVFMQNAGMGVAIAVQEFVKTQGLKKAVLILAGKGNNAGDAFVAGCRLLEEGYQVEACSATVDEEESALCRKNKRLFKDTGGKLIPTPNLPEGGLILDGIFGTGLNKAPKGPYAKMIDWANTSPHPILAIDIPSGLSGDSGEVLGTAIKAKLTLALGLPKMGFFLSDGWNHVGELKFVDFGLPKDIVEAFNTPFKVYEKEKCLEKLPPIKRNRHKYEAGEVIAFAGSPEMSGAAILTSYAALKAGSGMVKLYHPPGMEAELSASPFELIKIPYCPGKLANMEKAKAFLAGPGLGRTKEVKSALKEIFEHMEVPCVIDADALFFLSEGTFKAPENAVLTPHIGEMNRLLNTQETTLTLDYLKRCREYAAENKINLVLKGGPSFIFSKGGPAWINLTGDPGMATAGSGDVLTGIIAALLAQGMDPSDAAAAGVCIHGWAGQFASKILSPYCMVAGDIINCLPMVFSLK